MEANNSDKNIFQGSKDAFCVPFWKMCCNRLVSFCNRLPVKKTNHPNAVNGLQVNVDGVTKCPSSFIHCTSKVLVQWMKIHSLNKDFPMQPLEQGISWLLQISLFGVYETTLQVLWNEKGPLSNIEKLKRGSYSPSIQYILGKCSSQWGGEITSRHLFRNSQHLYTCKHNSFRH